MQTDGIFPTFYAAIWHLKKEEKKMRLNKLAVVFAAAALSAVMVAGCSGGQKESAAESEAETSAKTTEA